MTQAHILLAHGSRNAEWRRPFEVLAARFGERHPERRVLLCYLEIWAPDLPQTIAQAYADGARQFRISPLFWSSGRHLQEDLPLLISELEQRFPDIRISMDEPLGEREPVLAAVLDVLA
ncbi:MAG: sirohydrochlorin chelatase [Acidithiobacillus sp.]